MHLVSGQAVEAFNKEVASLRNSSLLNQLQKLPESAFFPIVAIPSADTNVSQAVV